MFAKEKEKDNDRFADFVKECGSTGLDALVNRLNDAIAPKINCTDCGNCCRSLMINVSAPEADRLSAHLQQDREYFDTRYIEKGANGEMMVLNAIPCHFLSENKCTIYEHRFEGCREFPAMHLPGFKKRLFTTFMHYGRCPIIFNVVEQLKTALGFQ
ncbi:MAG: YkgJ family cysteine cluster protein [Sediminibacterium sp.]